jgi:phosphatidylethanolamine N-methyltransferase
MNRGETQSLTGRQFRTVPRRERSESFSATRQAVVTIVALSVDLDPKLIPQCAATLAPRLASGTPYDELSPTELSSYLTAASPGIGNETSGPAPLLSPAIGEESDDFAIMDEHQVKRITLMLKLTFDVDLSMDMILANTNVTAITKRVRDSRRLVEEVGTNTASG